MPTRTHVYLEVGTTRVFAAALDWPGWARAARTPEAALQALDSYGRRYAPVAVRAGVRFPASHDLVVVEQVAGTPTTDFGAPSVEPAADSGVLSAAAQRRQVALLQASWDLLDDVVASAPEALRKGPRGGGRDRDEVLRHVVEAERAYARKVGVRHPPFRADDLAAREAMRTELAAALAAGPSGPVWSLPYFVRRAAWHVLDHAWEIEDRTPGADG
jgi:hypothetical protein